MTCPRIKIHVKGYCNDSSLIIASHNSVIHSTKRTEPCTHEDSVVPPVEPPVEPPVDEDC